MRRLLGTLELRERVYYAAVRWYGPDLPLLASSRRGAALVWSLSHPPGDFAAGHIRAEPAPRDAVVLVLKVLVEEVDHEDVVPVSQHLHRSVVVVVLLGPLSPAGRNSLFELTERLQKTPSTVVASAFRLMVASTTRLLPK